MLGSCQRHLEGIRNKLQFRYSGAGFLKDRKRFRMWYRVGVVVSGMRSVTQYPCHPYI